MKKYLILFVLLAFASVCFGGSQQTSSTPASTFIIDVRKDYNDLTTVHFSAEEMLEFLNDGMIDIANKSHCLEETEDINLIADTIEYSITSNYVDVVGVAYNPASGASKGLQRGSLEHRGKIQGSAFGDTTTPAFWYEFNGKIGVYPSLTSVTSETITVYLAERPSTITSSDNITIPTIYENALKLYMLARMALKDKNINLKTDLMNQYNAELGVYRKDLTEQR